jgi:hypothetical protein
VLRQSECRADASENRSKETASPPGIEIITVFGFVLPKCIVLWGF